MKHDKYNSILIGTLLGLQAMVGAVHAATVHTIDVLGIYSDHVAQRISDPEALFASNIEYANQALQNSGANYRYHLVHVQQQNWASDDTVGSSQLISLAQDAEVQQLREEYGADLVAGMVPTGSRYCGIGYLPSANPSSHTFYYWASRYGYSLSGDTCGGRTMTHEIGHTMGLGHSPAQGSTGTVATWGRGWGVNGSFVTIMAYNSAYGVGSSSGRLQIHSNPDLSTCKGQACGQSVDQQDGANAALALNLAAPQVAEWMPTAVVVPQNTPPIAVDDSAIVDAGNTVTIDVLNNDSDPDGDALSLSAIAQPGNGTVEMASNSTQVMYTSSPNFAGVDNFGYTVKDAKGAEVSAVVSVQVNEVLPPVVEEDLSNLALNGGAESGLESWSGWWGTSVALSGDAQSGSNSIAATGGRGVVVDLRTPFQGGRNFAISGGLKTNAANRVYTYLRLRQNGVWRYWYLAGYALSAGDWLNFDKLSFSGYSSNVDEGVLLFYFPYGIAGEVLIDGVRVEQQ